MRPSMKLVKLSIAAAVLAASMTAFAQTPENNEPGFKFAQCPPASALHHYGVGQPWVLDEPYKSEGWMVMQTQEANWNYLNSIPKKTPLSVRITDESAYLSTGKTVSEKIVDPDGTEHVEVYDVFKAAGGTVPVTCSYPYKIVAEGTENNYSENIVVKSPFETSPGYLMTEAYVTFKFQNDSVDYPRDDSYKTKYPESSWGWVCNTTAGTPEACKFKVRDLSLPPSQDGFANAKLAKHSKR